VDQLFDPSEQSRRSLEAALSSLNISSLGTNRSVAVKIEADDGDVGVVAEVAQFFPASPGRTESNRISIDYYYDGYHGHVSTYTDGELQSPEAQECYAKVVEWLGDVEESPLVDWLRDAASELSSTQADAELAPICVGRLLDDAPVEAGEYSAGYINADYANGARVQGNTLKANQAFLEALTSDPDASGQELMSLWLTCPDKTEYQYARYVDGREELSVRHPETAVPREVVETNAISGEVGSGLGVTISGDPEFMRAMHAEMAAHAEEKALGLLVPTEGKIKAFTAALGAAIFSGQLPSKR
jgi:hypothetical protein